MCARCSQAAGASTLHSSTAAMDTVTGSDQATVAAAEAVKERMEKATISNTVTYDRHVAS